MSQFKSENEPLLSVDDLVVRYVSSDDIIEAINGVSFTVEKGETMGLVGETGAGKTTIALAIMRLLDTTQEAIIEHGKIRFHGDDIYDLSDKEFKKICGGKISMIFQDPMTALNPVITVVKQVAEKIRIHTKCSRAEADYRAREVLEMVGIQRNRHDDYPHQFSGGMKQRVVIAIAISCSPELIIADEPTSALDVTIQAQVLKVIADLKKQLGTSMILISHDLGIIAETCDRCAVMYAGKIVEMGSLEAIFDRPMHPYTQGLFNSLPKLDEDTDMLIPIDGLMSDPANLPPYCSFYDRCKQCNDSCKKGFPELKEYEPGHFVSCFQCLK